MPLKSEATFNKVLIVQLRPRCGWGKEHLHGDKGALGLRLLEEIKTFGQLSLAVSTGRKSPSGDSDGRELVLPCLFPDAPLEPGLYPVRAQGSFIQSCVAQGLVTFKGKPH